MDPSSSPSTTQFLQTGYSGHYAEFAAQAGSWFTAMTLQKAAYVQVVGQIEIVLSLLVSRLMFRERIAPLELTGTILFVGGLVLLLLTGEA